MISHPNAPSRYANSPHSTYPWPWQSGPPTPKMPDCPSCSIRPSRCSSGGLWKCWRNCRSTCPKSCKCYPLTQIWQICRMLIFWLMILNYYARSSSKHTLMWIYPSIWSYCQRILTICISDMDSLRLNRNRLVIVRMLWCIGLHSWLWHPKPVLNRPLIQILSCCCLCWFRLIIFCRYGQLSCAGILNLINYRC